MSFDGEDATLDSYELVPIDENVAEDAEIAAKVQGFKDIVEEEYLAEYGMTFNGALVENQYKFDSVDDVYATQHESTLGNLFSDAYKRAVENATGRRVDVALTASGVIRETLPIGGISASDVFNAAFLGVGTEGELIKIYLTGKDLKAAPEVDTSVRSLMRSAQLFFSGVEYSFNTYRRIFNKVDCCMLRNANVFTFAAIGLVVLLLGIIALIVILITRKVRKKKLKAKANAKNKINTKAEELEGISEKSSE